jgi:hypothetical protein
MDERSGCQVESRLKTVYLGEVDSKENGITVILV